MKVDDVALKKIVLKRNCLMKIIGTFSWVIQVQDYHTLSPFQSLILENHIFAG